MNRGCEGLKDLAVLVGNVQKCPEIEEKNRVSSLELKIEARRHRIIELRKLGLKIPEIQRLIAEETGVWWNEKTIRRDLCSITAKEELEELNRNRIAILHWKRTVRLGWSFGLG